MKKVLLFAFLCSIFLTVNAAPFRFLETIVIQPDGSQLTLYASGDEFYHWVHDKDGYTILQGEDGYCYYARKDDSGNLKATTYRADNSLPADAGIRPWSKVSEQVYAEKRDKMLYSPSTRANGPQFSAHKGKLNNIVIFISFPDATKFKKKRSVYESRFNSTSSASGSLKDYYQEVSYSNLTIESVFFPEADLDNDSIGYRDFHKRGFYRAYNATTNTDGYRTSDEQTNREHNLLVSAVDAMRSKIEAAFTPEEIDNDGDGLVDNVCFVIQGNSDGWSDLLWAHRWSLYTKNCFIHGKRVLDYVFQPENQVTINTLCHEMFHALGAPDLYHYREDQSKLEPVGAWGLMGSGWTQMGAYMKWKYARQTWIKEIPVISKSGRYSLKPLQSGSNNVCYKVLSNNPNEYYVLEYRKKEGKYEKNLIRAGLLVYRINTTVSAGNRNGPPDEVYIYRPFGSMTENGRIDEAAFQTSSGAVISDKTFPKPFLTDETDGGLRIHNLTIEADQLSFDIALTATGIAHLDSDQHLNLFVADRTLTIHSDEDIKSIYITTVTGQRVLQTNNVDEGVSLNSLTSGIYIVSIISNKDTYQRKIIIK